MMDPERFEERLEEVLALPDPREAFAGLAGLYLWAASVQREAIRERWDFQRAWAVPDPRTLACPMSGSPPCEERIRQSLIYHSIEDFRTDYRDNLVGLCVIHHGALEAGMDSEALFEEIAALSSDRGAGMIREFVRRPPGLKALSAFGWKKVVSKDGVLFEGG